MVASGTAALMCAGLAVGALLAQPTFAAQPATPTTTDPRTPTATDPRTPTATTPRTPTADGTPAPSSTACYTYTAPTLLPGGVALASDFEDGTTGGWYGAPGVTATNTTELASGGTHSLRVDGLTSTASVHVAVNRLPNWGWYRATVRVRVPATVPSASYLTLRATSVASTIPGTARVSSDGWATVTAYFQPATLHGDWLCNGVMTGTQIPAPATIGLTVALGTCGEPVIDRPSTVYLDDVVVTGTTGTVTAPPPTVPQTPSCVTTTSPPPAQCVARQTVQSQWPGGYVASVQITNASPSALTGWSFAWTFPGTQQVSNLWGAQSWTQTGPRVTLAGPPWAPIAGNGGTATVGFVGQGVPGNLAAVTLDGMSCGVPSI
jgi:hypothetical protein